MLDGVRLKFSSHSTTGNEIGQMIKVVGEEGTSIEDFTLYLKSEFLDAVYLQQDAYDAVDAATSADRQSHVFKVLSDILNSRMKFDDKEAARRFFHQLTQITRDWNRTAMDSEKFTDIQQKLETAAAEVTDNA